MEFNRYFVELPITNKGIHAFKHLVIQHLENIRLRVFLDRCINFWFQLLPGQRLNRVGSRLNWVRSRLNWAGSRLNRVGSLLVLEGVANLLKRLFALRIAQDSSSGEKYGSIVLELNRYFVELLSSNKFIYAFKHLVMQLFEISRLRILLDR